MPSPRIVRISRSDERGLAEIRDLFTEYAAWLSPFITRSTIAGELATLPAPFEDPDGVLLGARYPDGRLCGCVAVKCHSKSQCEIKRLFVRPDCRGRGLGYTLFSAALDAACKIGYTEALVSTVPSFMTEANAMYERLGFKPTECFEDHTHDEVEIAYLHYPLTDWCR